MNHPSFFLCLGLASMALSACDQKSTTPAAEETSTNGTPLTIQMDRSDASPVNFGPNTPTGFTQPYQDILANVNAQCPDEYPDIVTPIPDNHELVEKDSAQLMSYLESWNPVLRMNAAKELGTRGPSVVDELRKGTRSSNGKIRAGSATALAAICKSVPSEQLPVDLANDFIRLSTDDEHEVRVAALKALSAIEPKTKETTLAVLAMCTDDNEYLAQDAKMALDKSFQAHTLPIEDIEAGLKAAMGGPLPRGKGHIVKILGNLKPKDQGRFIPELLTHLDWYADRDTMFAGGGQQQALEILTRLEEPELVPRLPKLMGKKGRGMHLYTASIESARALGPLSKPLYDELKAIYKEMEKLGKDAPITPKDDLKEGMDDLKRLLLELEAY